MECYHMISLKVKTITLPRITSHSLWPDLSPQLTELLCQMMDPQPDHRPTASNLLQHKKINLIIWKSYCKKKANSIVSVQQHNNDLNNNVFWYIPLVSYHTVDNTTNI